MVIWIFILKKTFLLKKGKVVGKKMKTLAEKYGKQELDMMGRIEGF